MTYIAHVYLCYACSSVFLSHGSCRWSLSFSVLLPLSYLSLASARCFSHLFDPDTAWENLVASKIVESKTFCALSLSLSLSLCVFVCVLMGNENIFFTSAFGERMDFKYTAPFLLAKQKMRVSWQHRNSCPQYVCVYIYVCAHYESRSRKFQSEAEWGLCSGSVYTCVCVCVCVGWNMQTCGCNEEEFYRNFCHPQRQ